jgi:ABC-type polysaccharide/polyol phosphate export permease
MNKELSIIKYWDISFFLAQQDLKSRFRGSKLGILWLAINQLSFSLGAGFIWSKVFGTNANEFIPFLSIGFAIWSFISSAMIEGCSTFINAHHYIKQLPLPKIIFIMRTFLVSVCYFSVSFFTCLIVLLCFNKLHLRGIFFSIPGYLAIFTVLLAQCRI